MMGGMVEQPDELDEYVEEKLRTDPEFREAYEDVKTLFDLTFELKVARRAQGLSQTEVARRMSTTQSAVSELELGGADPYLSTLQRYARAVGLRLRVEMEKPEQTGDTT